MPEFTAVTQCPYCNVAFLVGLRQLSQAQGKVRCGSCMGIFHARQSMVVEQKNLFAMDGTILNPVAVAQPLQSSNESTPKPTDFEPEQSTSEEPMLTQTEEGSDDFADLMNSHSSLRNLDNEKLLSGELDSYNLHTNDLHAKNEALDDFIVEPGEHVHDKHDDLFAPNNGKAKKFRKNSFIGDNWFYIVGIAVALTLLVVQFIWLLGKAPDSKQSRLHCLLNDCSVVVDIATKIDIKGNVRFASESNDILVATVELHNKDLLNTYQLPNIVISFEDESGIVQAGREFLPKNYLPVEKKALTKLGSNQRLEFSLNFLHPGKKIDRFKLSVKENID